jgi:hypothetical protein
MTVLQVLGILEAAIKLAAQSVIQFNEQVG